MASPHKLGKIQYRGISFQKLEEVYLTKEERRSLRKNNDSSIRKSNQFTFREHAAELKRSLPPITPSSLNTSQIQSPIIQRGTSEKTKPKN